MVKPSNDARHLAERPLKDRDLAGRYRLVELIATGGMAQVWRAQDRVLDREVAVKVLHRHLGADADFVARFRREARAAARLSHPSIVAIFDTCSEDGIEAIVMELVRGETLRSRLDRGAPLSPRQFVAVMSQVADALQIAHGAGLVHRDVKPANILLCEDERVKVADFGIAKDSDTSDLTRPDAMIGTAKYLAPEQVDGGEVTPRSDVYSLGVVMYEALCGRPPFDGDTPLSTALARLHDNPLLPRHVRPGVNRDLEAVTLRAMSRDPANRHPSAEALRADLLAVPLPDRDDTPPAGMFANPPSFAQSERSWLVPALFVVVVAAALGVAGLLFGRTTTGQDLVDRVFDAVGSQATSTTTPQASGAEVNIVGFGSFDPQTSDGVAQERESDVPKLFDQDPSTEWSTELYNTRAFGELKDGVGVHLTLGGEAPVDALVVTSPTTAWSGAVYVSDKIGTTLAEWGDPVATATDVVGDHRFELGGTTTSNILLWITDLGTDTVDDRGRVRARFSGLTVELAS